MTELCDKLGFFIFFIQIQKDFQIIFNNFIFLKKNK